MSSPDASQSTAVSPVDLPDGVTADEIASGIITADGEPFPSKRAATSRLKELGLPDQQWEAQAYGGGFAIVRKLGPAEARQDAPGRSEPYKWVRFHHKSNPMDPDEVVLGVNGEVLIVRRNERVPMPQRFLEVADHATYRHFTQEPGRDRKVDREIHKYPYDVLGEATREDFIRWKRAGTKATRDHAERLGIAVEA